MRLILTYDIDENDFVWVPSAEDGSTRKLDLGSDVYHRARVNNIICPRNSGSFTSDVIINVTIIAEEITTTYSPSLIAHNVELPLLSFKENDVILAPHPATDFPNQLFIEKVMPTAKNSQDITIYFPRGGIVVNIHFSRLRLSPLRFSFLEAPQPVSRIPRDVATFLRTTHCIESAVRLEKNGPLLLLRNYLELGANGSFYLPMKV
jgi:hypothetical protein